MCLSSAWRSITPRATSPAEWSITTKSRGAVERSRDGLRLRAVSYSLLAAVGLTAVKLVTAWWTGSLSVLSEGVHSGLDLVSAALAFVAVRAADKPADEDHPYGHGKFETLSSLLESILLVIAGLWLIWEALQQLRHPVAPQHEGAAIAVIGLSMLVSWAVYKHNQRVGSELESPAIEANALHFLADTVTSVGVLLGLVLMALTGWAIVDPLLAVCVSGYILAISYRQILKALGDLSDTQLPERDVSEIRAIVDAYRGADHTVIESHDLRTRRSGSQRHIDFHLVVCGRASVRESHDVCDKMENQLMTTYPGSSVNIHVEPCEHENTSCLEDCPYKLRGKKAGS